jgi:uncharacterized membrane protein
MVSLGLWLKLLHILGAIVWVGGGVMLSLVGGRAKKSGDPRIIADFAKTLSYVGLRALMPAVIVVLVTGVWIVLATSGFSFTQLWVLLALGAFAIAFLIGAVYLSRVAINLERLATGTNPEPLAIRDLLSRWIIGYQVILLVLVFAVWDMVFKPGF